MNVEMNAGMLKGSLDIQAQSAAAIISGGTQAAAPQGASPADEAARSAGLAAEGKGQNIDTTA